MAVKPDHEERWRKILKAYIVHVSEVEGTHFLNGVHGMPEGLSDEEIACLERARDEVDPKPYVIG